MVTVNFAERSQQNYVYLVPHSVSCVSRLMLALSRGQCHSHGSAKLCRPPSCGFRFLVLILLCSPGLPSQGSSHLTSVFCFTSACLSDCGWLLSFLGERCLLWSQPLPFSACCPLLLLWGLTLNP